MVAEAAMSDILSRKEASYARRSLALRKKYGMKWSRRDSVEFLRRVMNASCVEGVDDKDLTVLVRMFHRELIGRSHND